MPYFRINIDGRIYEGEYGSKPDAVYGAMCKDSIDRGRACYAIASTKDRSEAYREMYAEDAAPSLIGVEKLDHRVTKKIHRVLDEPVSA